MIPSSVIVFQGGGLRQSALRALLLFFQDGVTRLDQLVELLLLLGDPLGGSFFVLCAGRPGSLFDQLSQIVLKYRDAVVEFRQGKRIVVAHFGS
jgi:hypothetical protein